MACRCVPRLSCTYADLAASQILTVSSDIPLRPSLFRPTGSRQCGETACARTYSPLHIDREFPRDESLFVQDKQCPKKAGECDHALNCHDGQWRQVWVRNSLVTGL